MTVRKLIERLNTYDPEQLVVCVCNGGNPHSDYVGILDSYEIRGAIKGKTNCVIIETQ